MSTWHEKLANRKQNQLDEERKKKVEVNDISFPSLGNGGSAWGGSGTGSGSEKVAAETKPKLASLVAGWDAKTKEEQEIRKMREIMDRNSEMERNRSGVFVHSLYRSFGNIHSRDEDTYYEDEYEDRELPPVPTADTSSDWRTVEKPVRKPKKSAVEKMMMENDTDAVPIEDTIVWRGEEESVWGGGVRDRL
jgi:hypothetical protein